MHHLKRYHKHIRTIHHHLKRTLGFWLASIDGIGIIVGAGIYALIGVAAGITGPALWMSFVVAGIIAGLTGLSYAELSSIFKTDAGEYDYLKKAFNKRLGLIVSIMIIFATLFTAAAVSFAFGGYFERLTGYSVFWAAAALLIISAIINYLGIRQSTIVNVVLTTIGLAGLIVIIGIGLPSVGTVNLFEMPNGVSSIFRSAALVFFSYLGFESIIKLTEETKKPAKNIPRAILFSITISTILYTLVAVTAVSVIPWQSLGTSTSPLADIGLKTLGSSAFLAIGIIALFSTANTVLMQLVTSSRMIYGLGCEHALPQYLCEINEKTRTPLHAIIIVSLASILFLKIGNLERLASLTNFFTFITFALVNFSVIVLRKTYPIKRPFKVPLEIFGIPILPLLGGLSSVGMLYFVVKGII